MFLILFLCPLSQYAWLSDTYPSMIEVGVSPEPALSLATDAGGESLVLSGERRSSALTGSAFLP